MSLWNCKIFNFKYGIIIKLKSWDGAERMALYYIDRKTGKKEKEIVYGDFFLKLAYEYKIGMPLLEAIVKKKIFSTLYGKLQDTRFSAGKINKFIRDYNIDLEEAEIPPGGFKSFNDFFARKLKPSSRPIAEDKNILISPADGRLLAFDNIDKDKILQIKGSYYKLEDLLRDKSLALEYHNGTCIIIRLCPTDYHRFHFPDEGYPDRARIIDGDYYSVNPLSLKNIKEVYCKNKREITIFNSLNFGKMLLIEVGATCVGSIIQTYKPFELVKKGDEKGYFKFGGSTVIILLKKGIVKIDDDLLKNTGDGIETKVSVGERIGYRI